MNENKRMICFVCTGNTCRSPMAAVIFNHFYAGEMFYAESAGLIGGGNPISAGSSGALRASGLFDVSEYTSHVSRVINEDIMKRADMVIAMSGSHMEQLVAMFPEYADKIMVMPFDIPDPYGGGASEYELCYKNITAALEMMFGFSKDMADEMQDM